MYMLAHMDTVTVEFDTLWDECECYSPFLQHITYKDLVEAACGVGLRFYKGRWWPSPARKDLDQPLFSMYNTYANMLIAETQQWHQLLTHRATLAHFRGGLHRRSELGAGESDDSIGDGQDLDGLIDLDPDAL